jgi:hypothetical protein
MYAVFCAEAVHLQHAALAFPPDRRVVATDEWRVFDRAARDAACLVVIVRWLHEWPNASCIGNGGGRTAARPLVVVTTKDADNARLLSHLHADEVVWLGEVDRALWQAVRAAESRQLLHRLANAFERSRLLPPVLRLALAHGCRSERPVRSVAELARGAGRDRRTLWRAWQDAARDHARTAPPLRLHDVVHWLLILRAASRKTSRESWSSVARGLGVHEHTLARAAAALVGTSLRQLSVDGEPVVARGFERQVVVPLLGADSSLDALPAAYS